MKLKHIFYPPNQTKIKKSQKYVGEGGGRPGKLKQNLATFVGDKKTAGDFSRRDLVDLEADGMKRVIKFLCLF